MVRVLIVAQAPIEYVVSLINPWVGRIENRAVLVLALMKAAAR
jgi:hypothetical protein